MIWTGIWASTDNGLSWRPVGAKARFPASLHNGYAQLWSWDYNPDDGWVYVVSTGFQRDKGDVSQDDKTDKNKTRGKYHCRF